MVGYSGVGYANPNVYFSGSYLDPSYAPSKYWDGRSAGGPGGSTTQSGSSGSADSAVSTGGSSGEMEGFVPKNDRGGADFSGAHVGNEYSEPSMDNNYGFNAVPDAVRAFGAVPGAKMMTGAVVGGFALNNAAAINNAREVLGLETNSVLGGMYNANAGIIGTVSIGDQTYTVAMDPNPEDPNQVTVNEALTISAETLNDITEATPDQVESRNVAMKEAGTTPTAGGIKSALSNIAGTVTGGLVGTDPNATVNSVETSMPTPSVEAQNRAVSTYNEQFDNPTTSVATQTPSSPQGTQVASLDPSFGIDSTLDAGVSMAPDATEQGVNALGVADRGYVSPMGGVTGRTTSGFGARSAPKTSMGVGTSMHKGVDFSAAPGAMGQTVQSVNSGTVTAAGPRGKLGNAVSVQHPDGRVSTYGHLGNISVSVGDEIGTGTPVGEVGNTGNTSGPHLHFGITDLDGVTAVNPSSVIGSFDPGIATPGMKPDNPTEQATSFQEGYTPGEAVSPSGFASMGMGAQYTSPELGAMGKALAGTMSPESLEGLAMGDEAALAEAYGILGNMDNTAMTKTAMDQTTTVGPMEGALTPENYSALSEENLDSTLDSYSQYQGVIDNTVENYAMGLGTPTATAPDAWGQVQDAYGTAFGPAAAVGIGQENVSGLAAPSSIDSRMDTNMMSGDLGLAGGYLSGTNLDTGMAEATSPEAFGGLAMADTESSVATGDGTTAAAAADAASDAEAGSQDSGSDTDSGSDSSGGDSGGEGGSRGGDTSSGASGNSSGDKDGRSDSAGR